MYVYIMHIGKSLDIIKARLSDTIRLWFNVISAKLEINIADNLAIDILGTRQRDDNKIHARVLMVTMWLTSLPPSLSLTFFLLRSTYPAR